MTRTLTVLDGFAVQVHPSDRYANAHLFVRSTYVHRILVTDTGALLTDAAQFAGARTMFTPEEVAALQALAATVQAEEQARLARKQTTQAQAAQRVIQAHDAKLSGMDETKIYD